MAEAVHVLKCDHDGCDYKETDEWKTEDDDFLICIKSGCNQQYSVMCRGCMSSSHRRKGDHALEKDPDNFINMRSKQTICSKCNKSYSNNHLFVCIKKDCEHYHQFMCTNCMAESHKNNNDHNPNNDTDNFVLLKQWYSLVRMNQIKPDGWPKAIAKVSAKAAYHGGGAVCATAYAAYSLLDETAKLALKEIPKNATHLESAKGIIGALKVSQTPAAVVMKNMAKSQAFVNGLVFAVECGWYAFDYGYNGNGTYDQMIVKIQTAAKAHTSAFVCSMILGGIGFMIGGPWGATIGAAIGGIVGDYGMRKYCNADDEKEYAKKQEKIRAALRTFDYGNRGLNDVLKDTNTFNMDELQRRYRLKAVLHHPDFLRQMDFTDEEIQKKWTEFYSKYLILLEVCKQRDDGK